MLLVDWTCDSTSFMASLRWRQSEWHYNNSWEKDVAKHEVLGSVLHWVLEKKAKFVCKQLDVYYFTRKCSHYYSETWQDYFTLIDRASVPLTPD